MRNPLTPKFIFKNGKMESHVCPQISIYVVPEFQNHVPLPISVDDVEPIQLTSELLLDPIFGYNNYSEFVQGRSKLDVNRPLKEGAEGFPGGKVPSDSQIAWNDYHTFMNNAVEEVEERFSRGLLIDIHGHGHSENYIELGYVLSSETLTRSTDALNSDPKIPASSSIRTLYNRKQSSLSFAELLRGKTTSLGGRLQSYGYDTLPSHVHKHPLVHERYFHGGYSVQKYGSRHGEQVIDAIQIELPRSLRLGNKEVKDKFIIDFAESLSWFVKEYYWKGGQGSKRLTIDVPTSN
ncbi:hypothetical protein C1645_735060 [Glomus cerebriforme]|uniref:N-formylglutamate amidohydrolase n=1 Tax=Glomus cerebriforme TaxID=658196 RepID=A0A397T845_9GLOM|nr:hypothetical protein C1645_735060 [Glomus cerebriforme]